MTASQKHSPTHHPTDPLDALISTAACLQSWQSTLLDARHAKAELNIQYGLACANKHRDSKARAQNLCAAGASTLLEIAKAEARIAQLTARLREVMAIVESSLPERKVAA